MNKLKYLQFLQLALPLIFITCTHSDETKKLSMVAIPTPFSSPQKEDKMFYATSKSRACDLAIGFNPNASGQQKDAILKNFIGVWRGYDGYYVRLKLYMPVQATIKTLRKLPEVDKVGVCFNTGVFQ